MKKAVKIALPLLLIAFIVSTQAIIANYQVTVSSVYQYDVTYTDLNINFGTNTADLDGFEIDGQFYNPGAVVQLNVTSVSPTQVLYNISSGSYSEIRETVPLDLLYVIFYMIYPIGLIHDVSTDPWNETQFELDFHPGIMMVPFIEVEDTTWNDWIDAANEINTNKTLLAYTFDNVLTLEAAYYNLTNDFVFEIYMNGQLNEQYTSYLTTSLINVTIEHQYQFAYTKATGAMLGMRMTGTISGFCNGTVVNIDYRYRTEQVGYDLPAYKLGGPTWPFPGFEYLAAIGVLGILAIPIVIVHRRKK